MVALLLLPLLLPACSGRSPVVETGAFTDSAEPEDTGPPEALIRRATLRGEVGEQVQFDATRSQRASTFTWTFGDGESDEGVLVEHIYDAPGRYTAYLEVENTLGQADAVAFSVIITWPALDALPSRSAMVDGDADSLYAVMPDHDLVARVDRASAELVGHIATCAHPRSLDLSEDGVLAVACQDDDRVMIYADGSARYAQLPWGSRPFGVVLTEDHAWVTLQGGGALARVNVDNPDVIEITEIGADLRGLALVGGKLIVSRHRSPDEGGQWWVVDADSLAVQPYALAIDPGPDSDVNARGLPNHLQRLAVRPDGRAVAIAGNKANTQRGLYNEGQAFTHETTVRADLRVASLNRFEGAVGGELLAANFDNRDLVTDLAYSPMGDVLYVAHGGAEIVDMLDPWTLARLGGLQGVATFPDGLWVSEDGEQLAVLSSIDRALLIYDVEDLSDPELLHRVDLGGGVEEPMSAEFLQGKVVFHRSVDPRMSTDAYVSCASCHLDGEHDGRTWDFTDRGEGLRNTLTLRGLGADHGPLHWSANFDELQDFENDIRGPQAGEGFLSDEDWAECSDTLGPAKAGRSEALDALASYVTRLSERPRSPAREADGSLTPAAQRGEAVFLSAETGCASCHPAPSYSDSAWLSPGEPRLHDVGTLGEGSGQRLGGELTGLDTPRLRGLHASAPYLHDGSAATLREVLVDRNAADAHGHTSGLSEAALVDLEAFLLSLE